MPRANSEGQLTPLARLLVARRDQLQPETMTSIIRRSELPPETVYGHMRRTRPYRSAPTDRTVKGLAAGFKVDATEIADAAYNSMRKISGEVRGNPLQLLVTRARHRLALSVRQVAERASAAGYPLSEAAVASIENGQRVRIRDSTVRALAAALELDVPTVRKSVNRAAGEDRWVLPAHMQARMTEKQWRALMAIADTLLAESE